MFMSGCYQKGNLTIYEPDVEKNETNRILEISKIVFIDTATVFYFDAYHCTNSGCWFSIAEESVLQGSHKTYKIIGSDGIELGKRMQVSESGHLAFVLYFEPVDKSEKTVDFKDSDNNRDFSITGIKLYQTPKPTGAIKCTLKGEVIDRPQSSRLMLLKEGEDLFSTKGISIPIRNGKFEYVLNCNHEEFYQLIFYDEWMQSPKRWRPVMFISEQGVINFTLHPEGQHKMNRVENGKLNNEYQDFIIEEANINTPSPYDKFHAIINQLRTDGKYYTSEAQSLLNQISVIADNNKRRALSEQYQKLSNEGFDITPAAKEAIASIDSIRRATQLRRLQYTREHPNIVGYSILVSETRDVINSKNDISLFSDVYQTIFAPKYPDHPYTAKMIDLLIGSSLKSGIPFIDFTAVDLTGKQVTLSEQIAGKPAVLHLWASWCGPCRQKGKDLIPVYEEFCDKGFVVIGVAREKSISTAEAAVKSDKYPWENLVEIDDVEQIWNKYGLGNIAGGNFLIDENGIIVAVSPSIDEIRDFLVKYITPK